jgi:hypothetical protein
VPCADISRVEAHDDCRAKERKGPSWYLCHKYGAEGQEACDDDAPPKARSHASHLIDSRYVIYDGVPADAAQADSVGELHGHASGTPSRTRLRGFRSCRSPISFTALRFVAGARHSLRGGLLRAEDVRGRSATVGSACDGSSAGSICHACMHF